MTKNRDFYALFWLTPIVPVPAIEGEIISPGGFELPPDAQELREKLRSRLQSPRSDPDVSATIAVCDQYAALLGVQQEMLEPGCASTLWRSAISSETAELPLEMELPMVLVTRALLSIRAVRVTLAGRTPGAITQAVSVLQRAAGIVEHAQSLVDQPEKEEGSDTPRLRPSSALPELSFDILQALSNFCCGLAQQLAIVRAVLHFDKPYSKMVLLTLHSGCEAAFRGLESALSSSTSSPLCTFSSFFSRLHSAQAFQLAGEIEYIDAGIGEGIAYTLLAEQCFQEQAGGAFGLPSLSSVSRCVAEGHGGDDPASFEALARIVLTAKRERLATRAREWTQENDRSGFALIPPASELLSNTLPRVFLMKPHRTKGDCSDEDHSEDDHSDDGGKVDTEERHEKADAEENSKTRAEAFSIHNEYTGDRLRPLSAGSPSTQRVGPTEIDLDLALEPPTGERISVILRRSTVPADTRDPESSQPGGLPSINAQPVVPEARTSFVTSSARKGSLDREAATAARLRRELIEGKRVWRLNKYRKWKKETLTLLDSGLVFTRKQSLPLFRSQARVHWVSVLGLQLEHQGHGNSRVQSMQGQDKRETSILMVAGGAGPFGDSKTYEFTANDVHEDAALISVLQQEFSAFRQHKGAGAGRRKSVLLRQNTVSY